MDISFKIGNLDILQENKRYIFYIIAVAAVKQGVVH